MTKQMLRQEVLSLGENDNAAFDSWSRNDQRPLLSEFIAVLENAKELAPEPHRDHLRIEIKGRKEEAWLNIFYLRELTPEEEAAAEKSRQKLEERRIRALEEELKRLKGL